MCQMWLLFLHALLVTMSIIILTAFTVLFASFSHSESTMSPMNYCDGYGVALRTCTQTTHGNPRNLICANKGTYTGSPHNTVYIASDFDGKGDNRIEIRPCVECGNHVCDECRVHCVYQNLYDVKLYEGMGFGGHVFLRSWANHIYPLDDDESWKYKNRKKFRPHHDHGVLSLRLDGTLGTGQLPISIDTLLDAPLASIALNQHVLRNTTELYDPLIHDIVHAAEGRKWFVCDECFRDCGAGQKKCNCTLKSRFLDRWLCIPCYEHDMEIDHDYSRRFKKGDGTKVSCLCGKTTNTLHDLRTVCSWCDGEISCGLEGGDKVFLS
ncbi:hypothetical protein BDV96DRAFT_218352 [Lophiotrema nucula]|uniref:Uncharacterized protein n=1 Tax=Lophiotrema nucula TaxID=690887 RepID=A0A6A5ZS44_9PLEO|nr:hypothetical protein BDV96DRAFT_218352 [Lophiotrema nucula]